MQFRGDDRFGTLAVPRYASAHHVVGDDCLPLVLGPVHLRRDAVGRVVGEYPHLLAKEHPDLRVVFGRDEMHRHPRVGDLAASVCRDDRLVDMMPVESLAAERRGDEGRMDVERRPGIKSLDLSEPPRERHEVGPGLLDDSPVVLRGATLGGVDERDAEPVRPLSDPTVLVVRDYCHDGRAKHSVFCGENELFEARSAAVLAS